MLTLIMLSYSLPLVLGANSQKTDELATVVIFQTGRYGEQEFDLWLNDKSIMTPFKKNISITIQVNPGEIDLKVKRTRYLQSDSHYLMEVKAGSTYYLKASLQYNFPTTGLALTVENSEQYLKVEHKLKKIFLNVSTFNKGD